jgi:hypothetical protein
MEELQTHAASRWLEGLLELFFIEQVLDTKKINGRDYSLVRWEGYGSDFDQWVPTSEVTDVRRLQEQLQDDEENEQE